MEVYSRTTTLILFDIPSGAALTFDTFSFASTPSFRGIKYIPEGIHLFTYGLDKSELGIRSGFFFLGKPGNVSAWKWDKSIEQLIRIQETAEGNALEERIFSLPFLKLIRK